MDELSLVEQVKRQALAGISQDRDTVLALLRLPEDGPACRALKAAAHEVSLKITRGSAYLWGAVGVDYQKCEMNCKFCSFGEAWNIVKAPSCLSDEEIIKKVRDYVESGARFVVLRTTEFFSFDRLIALVKRIRYEIAGDYEVVLNAGEFNRETAERIFSAGGNGIYHALRLREGIDTAFAPETRLATLSAIADSPLKLIHLVEPVGPEHTDEELCDLFLKTMEFGVAIGGVMARVPVPGTPFGESGMISDERIAHIVAVFRLCAGYRIPDICVHPASAAAVAAGANVVVVEQGAVPRDSENVDIPWRNFDANAARTLLEVAGYEVRAKEKCACESFGDACACRGANLDRFIQPIILHLLKTERLTAYQICKRLSAYPLLKKKAPDVTGIYRYIKTMEEKGLLFSQSETSPRERMLIGLSDAGRHCLDNWLETLEEYREAIGDLISELKQ